ncbi:MAG TPA: phenylacetic acid degradation operon negative regulatory protein PaaX [Rhizobiales bacterium]|nr:phenylacetic acid degradation operon negative regulatory protein PaaX [Hyphomicrobiales bacterium]
MTDPGPITAQALLAKVNPRAGPMIITVFGDTIAPRGGSIWLGSLIELMQPLGLSERLVRTGVYRLAREKWLKARQDGRRSFYTITPEGLDSFTDADARIYAAHAIPWDGKWVIVQTLPDATPQARKKIRDLLTWHGFGQLSPTTMIKPGSQTDNVNQVLAGAGLKPSCIVFSSDLENQSDTRAIVTNGWDLKELSNAYQRLLNCFGDAAELASVGPQEAFVARSLIIHQYRRILLKDPQLPDELLPPDWNGEKARKLVAKTYHLLSPVADNFITEKMPYADNRCPPPAKSYRTRFM